MLSNMASCRYHCRACGSHFTSLEAFDIHRMGDPQNRRCDWPDEDLLVEQEGVCALGPGPERNAVTVYSTVRAVGVGERLRGRESVRPNV